MANEATVYSYLIINKGELQYQSLPTYFTADVTGQKGPTPGALAAAVTGTTIVLSGLTTPGLCRIVNLDPTNFVTIGVWEPDTSKWYPIMELLPGESYVFRLSRIVGCEEGTGTGTTAGNHVLQARADTAACNISVEAFEA